MRTWGESILMPNELFRSREFGFYLALAGVGVEMVVPIIVGAILDSSFHWTPYATLVGMVLGFVMSLVHLMVLLKRHDKPPQQPGQDKP